MYRESIKNFATGLLTATFIIGGYYYVTEDKQQQVELTFKDLEAASQKLGYTLVDNKAVSESNEQEEEATPKNEKESTSFLLTISKGMNSEDVEAILKEQAILSNNTSLSAYMSENNLADQIQIGEFVVTKEMTLQQIAKTITK